MQLLLSAPPTRLYCGVTWDDLQPQILLLYYNFTEITITTPPLTKILDRLIGGGIVLCGDGV